MRRIVFYSWQSDLSNATNRGLVQQALENVAKAIANDSTVDIEPVIDRDTEGIPGAPDISKTIFGKIAAADAIVADVSIVSPPTQVRPTPNPNVLVELGYALRALGDERVILVFNLAFGKPEDLPFDLRMRRVITYSSAEADPDRATARKALEGRLNAAVRGALSTVASVPTPSLITRVLGAIEGAAPNRVILVRRFMADLLERIDTSRPKPVADGGTAEELEQAILASGELTFDFVRLIETAATIGDVEVLRSVYSSFGAVLDRYTVLSGQVRVYPADYDFAKFLGHEWFVLMVACLLRERRWETIADLLTEDIPLRQPQPGSSPQVASFGAVSEHLEHGSALNKSRHRLSVHADILSKRYAQGSLLGQIVSFEDFIAADYFLYLRGQMKVDNDIFFTWRPWSSLYMNATPRFIIDARRTSAASRVAAALGLANAEELRRLLPDAAKELSRMWRNGFWRQPLTHYDIDAIGRQ